MTERNYLHYKYEEFLTIMDLPNSFTGKIKPSYCSDHAHTVGCHIKQLTRLSKTVSYGTLWKAQIKRGLHQPIKDDCSILPAPSCKEFTLQICFLQWWTSDVPYSSFNVFQKSCFTKRVASLFREKVGIFFAVSKPAKLAGGQHLISKSDQTQSYS